MQESQLACDSDVCNASVEYYHLCLTVDLFAADVLPESCQLDAVWFGGQQCW